MISVLLVATLAPCQLVGQPAGQIPGAETSRKPAWTRHDTLLNQFHASTQDRVGLDVDARGEVVTVWHSRRQEGGTYGVRARRLDATGAPLGDEVQVNVTEAGMQMEPSVSLSPSGASWFAWVSIGQDGDGAGVYARRFAPGLAQATEEIRVDDEVAGDQANPAIVALADGSALCVWTGPAEGLSGSALFARRLGADGAPAGERFRVDSEQSGGCWTPAIARTGSGAIVLHTRHDAAGRPSGLFLRTIDADGALGDETRVDPRGSAHAIEAVLAHSADDTVVAWLTAVDGAHRIDWRTIESMHGEVHLGDVQTLTVDGAGYTSGLAIDRDGDRTVIAWSRFGDGEDLEPGLFLATIDGKGTQISRVTDRVEGGQRLAIGGAARRLRLTADGGMFVAWNGDAGLGDSSGAHVTRLSSERCTAAGRADVAVAFEGAGAFEAAAQPTPHDPPTFDRKTVESQAPGAVQRGAGGEIDFRAFNSTGWTPPDPEMAVGHDHIVAVVNGGIKIFDKQGNQLFSDDISGSGGFWGSVGASSFVFDPEAIWDPHSNRYMALAANRDGALSYFLLAISDDADATGTWFKYRLDVTSFVGQDIDSVNISVDDDTIYLTGDWFSPTRFFVYMIDKASVLNGGTPVTRNLTINGRHSIGTPVNYDAGAPAQYLVWARESTSAASVTIYGIQDPLGTPSLQQVDVTVPTYRRPADAPQLGSSVRPELFEARFWNAVVRDGKLWCTHHQGAPAIQRWYEIELRGWPTSGQSPVLLQFGDIDDGTGASTYFGSLWVDGTGRMSLTCARSSATEPISMIRTFREPADPMGFTVPVETVITNTQPDGTGRWGDYSATSDDPAVPGRFWGHHEYRQSGWRTRIASVDTCSARVETFCTASPNSVGAGAVMGTTGSAVIGNNDLLLFASGTAPGAFGLFFYGSQETAVATGDGVRCVGGAVWRLAVTQSNFIGVASHAVDLTLPPDPAALITAGTTWIFQFVYRDFVAGGSGFNFSDALRVQFCD